MLQVPRLTHLGSDLDDLREIRNGLVRKVRDRVDRTTDASMQRLFTREDLSHK